MHHFRHDLQGAFEQQIVATVHRTGQGVLHRRQDSVGRAIVDGRKERLECPPRHYLHLLAEQTDDRFFAECATLALESDSQPPRRTHDSAPPDVSERTESAAPV